MKRYFGIIVAIVGISAAIYFAMKKWDLKTAESQREMSLAKLRGDYLERVPFVRSNPDEKAYKNEVQTFLSWYFKEVTEHLNKHGGNRKFDDYLIELDDRSKKKDAKGGDDGSKDKTEEKKAAYEYTKKVFDLLKGGTYAPQFTQTNNGIRLDILSADVERTGVDEKIHMPLVVWGLPREERVDDRNVHRVSVSGAFKFNFKLTDEKGKLIAEMPGEGGPNSRVEVPDRFVKFFPPSVLLGHYDIEKFPQEAKVVEMTFSIMGRTPTGGDVNANYTWKMDVPAAWKLAAGEVWKGATDSVRPEEEIDPAKAGKKK
jgi:hypothetical protein